MNEEQIVKSIGELYEELRRDIVDGENAKYIPELAGVNPDLFSISVCTVSGRTYSWGDSSIPFTLQGVCAPLVYCIVRDMLGYSHVHQHMGHEPSGQHFNAFALDEDGKPHNPMINTGAIMCCALLRRQIHAQADAFKHAKQFMQTMAGPTVPIGFDNTLFLSEASSADRNFALTYFMAEKNAVLKTMNIRDVLSTYFQLCSLTVTSEGLASIAATLASGGINPMTKEQTVSPATVRDTLQLMYSCGMDTASGRFAFEVGLPAKTGVSGGMMVVVPSLCGIAIFSPPLDKHGNSVRGVQLAKRLVGRIPRLNMFESMVHRACKLVEARSNELEEGNAEVMLFHAAQQGDVDTVRELMPQVADIDCLNYDGKTPLHAAAAAGHEEIVQMLVAAGADADRKDRFGNTPRSYSRQRQQEHIIAEAESDDQGADV